MEPAGHVPEQNTHFDLGGSLPAGPRLDTELIPGVVLSPDTETPPRLLPHVSTVVCRELDVDAALPAFSVAFPREMALLELTSTHPSTSREIRNPWTGGMETGDFTRIGRHSIAVAAAARALAGELAAAGAITEDERAAAVSLALLHDALKRYEIMHRAAGYPPGFEQTVEQELAALSVPAEDRAAMLHAQSITGHSSLVRYLEVKADGSVGLARANLADKIVHLADDMTSETRYVTAPERYALSTLTSRYPYLLTDGLSLDASGGLVETKGAPAGIGSYASLQLYVASEISKEIASIVAPNDPRDAEELLKDLLSVSATTWGSGPSYPIQ